MNLVIENLELYSREDLVGIIDRFYAFSSNIERKTKNLFYKSLLDGRAIAGMFGDELKAYNESRLLCDSSASVLKMGFSFNDNGDFNEIRIWWS